MSSNVGVNIWLAGAFAGVSINLLVFPLDTLKTRLQSPSFHERYRSPAGTADRALWRSLYQGFGTVLLIAVPSAGVFFTTYEGMKYALSSTTARKFLPEPAAHAISSSVAQLVNCAVVTPAEVIKQNAQMLDVRRSAGQVKASGSPVMQVLRQLKGHPTRLWRGYTALVARDLPFAALQFPAFEYLKKTLLARQARLGKTDGILDRAWVAGVSGGIAGAAAAWMTTPFDVVKTRMMPEAGANTAIDKPIQRQGPRKNGLQVGLDVFRNESIRGLFRGGLIRAAFTVVGNGLFMGCYEGAKLCLLNNKKAKEDRQL